MLARSAISVGISVEVLVTLAIVLAASTTTFWLLVRRWTSHRQWVALAEWARENEMRLHPAGPGQLPPPLDALARHNPTIRLYLSGETTLLIQLQTPSAGPDATAGQVIWGVLIRHLQTNWRTTGMRPTLTSRSILDLFSLSSYPMFGTERFTVFGTDSSAAAALSESMARSLLPPDVGLLLHGRELLLDFSDRPFDTIEFSRMISLADQLAEVLPA